MPAGSTYWLSPPIALSAPLQPSLTVPDTPTLPLLAARLLLLPHPHLPPGETMRYFTSSLVATAAYFAAFLLVISVAFDLRHALRESDRAVARSVARLATAYSLLWLLTALSYVLFNIMVVAGFSWRGTLRNYFLSPLVVIAAWLTRREFKDILFRTRRPPPAGIPPVTPTAPRSYPPIPPVRPEPPPPPPMPPTSRLASVAEFIRFANSPAPPMPTDSRREADGAAGATGRDERSTC